MRRRVVITGLGAVTSQGVGVGALWEGVRAGRSGIKFLTRFDTALFPTKVAAQVDAFDPAAHFPPHRLKRLDRYAQFSLAVASEALRGAGLERPEESEPLWDTGISFGTALGGIAGAEDRHLRYLEGGPEAIPPALALQVFGGSAHANIAIRHNLRGYATTNSNSCASGAVAIGEAFRAIRDGYAERMVAGAAEAPLSPLTFGAFDAIKSMTKETADPAAACRPFDRARSGFVMGEGGAALILEEREGALKRGATIHAEVLGYSLNNDAHHMTSSLADGAAAIRAMRAALDEAGVAPGQVGYVNAHASGTPMNDANEGTALRAVFGSSGSHRPAVSGTKPFTGHPLGATGALEAVLICLAFRDGWLPPNLNCPDPDVPDLDLVLGAGREAKVGYALSNSFGFGGINACLVLGAP